MADISQRAQRAFLLRISPSNIDRVDEALASNELIIGWSDLPALLDPHLSWWQFRQIMHDRYYAGATDHRGSGAAGGNMWRFIREMQVGDLVVVPHGWQFYVARVTGPARHDPNKVQEDTAFRRSVEWLNDKKPIPRNQAHVALKSRMKVYNTCADADDLVEEIKSLLKTAAEGKTATFEDDLRCRLIANTLAEIRSGRIDDYGFEHLLRRLLLGLGAEEARVVLPRTQDKGADIVATFNMANTFRVVLAVQAKHYQPEPPVGKYPIEQLLAGMEAEAADLGWVATSGTFSDEATTYANVLREEQGIKIELIDGDALATMIVDNGLSRCLDLRHKE